LKEKVKQLKIEFAMCEKPKMHPETQDILKTDNRIIGEIGR
jgi:hypothetical protein